MNTEQVTFLYSLISFPCITRMPLRNTIAQIALLAVALGGSQVMEARYGAVGAALEPLPGQERSVFTIADLGPPPGGGGGGGGGMMGPPPGGGGGGGGSFGGGGGGGSFGGGGGSQGGSGGGGGMMGGPGGGGGGGSFGGGQQGGPGGGGSFGGGQQGGSGGMMGGPGGQGGSQGGQQGGPGGQQGGRGGQQGGQQGGPGGGSFGGPGGQQGGDQGQMGGPSEEQQQKMQAKQDEQCKKQMAQQAKQMGKMFSGVDKKLASLQKQGVTPPASISDAITAAKAAIESLKSVEGCDAVQDIMQDLPEKMQAMQEGLQKLEQLAFLPRMKKDVTKQFGQMQKEWTRAKTRAQKVSGIDLSEIVAGGDAIMSALNDRKTAMFTLIDAVLAGQEDIDKLDDVFSSGDDVQAQQGELQEKESTIYALVDAPRGFTQVKRDRKNLDRSLKNLKRQKADTTDLEGKLGELDQALAALQQVFATKPLDPEDLRGGFESVQNLVHEANDLVNQTQGNQSAFQAPDLFGSIQGPSFQSPQAQ